MATGGTVGLTEWIIDDTCFVSNMFSSSYSFTSLQNVLQTHRNDINILCQIQYPWDWRKWTYQIEIVVKKWDGTQDHKIQGDLIISN